MRKPEFPEHDGTNPLERATATQQYTYDMAAYDRTVAKRWHKIARAAAIIMGVVGPATLLYNHYEHVPAREQMVIDFTEGVVSTVATNGIRMTARDREAKERTMDQAVTEHFRLVNAHALEVEPQAWAIDHVPFTTVHIRPDAIDLA